MCVMQRKGGEPQAGLHVGARSPSAAAQGGRSLSPLRKAGEGRSSPGRHPLEWSEDTRPRAFSPPLRVWTPDVRDTLRADVRSGVL